MIAEPITTVPEYAQAVKELLEEEGWIQGENHAPDGFCLNGALLNIRMKHYPLEAIGRTVRAKLLEKTGAATLSFWNDRPGRTKADVIALLDSVIDG